jgi:arylsulfatase A-like enzyme
MKLTRTAMSPKQKVSTGIAGLFLLLLLAGWKIDKTKSSPEKNNEEKPNVIFILTDDQGYGDVGYNRCKDIPTPNIDRIARNGVTFSSGYVSYAVCAPSRAGLITGRYQDRFGYSRNPLYRPFDETIGLPLSEQTLAEYLKLSGYHNMAIGKWHLGVHEKFHPVNRGFHEFFGFLGGGHRYFPEEFDINDPDKAKNEGESYRTKLVRNKNIVNESEYLTDALSREAVSFIGRQKKKPFFLYLAYNAPHSPLQAPAKYLDRFSNIQNTKRKTYAAMVSAVDDGVGLILNKLEELKIAENTIVIFLSDNGGPKDDNGSNNGPLRGGKSSFWEGGIRVPFAICWPSKIQPDTHYDKPVISLDIFATLASNIKGAPTPKNKLDGTDILPYLQGKKNGSPHKYLFWRHYDQKNYAAIDPAGMKEVIIRDSVVHLFELNKDIGEKVNLAAKEIKTTERIRDEIKKWEANTIPPAFLGLNQEEQYNNEKKDKTKQKN